MAKSRSPSPELVRMFARASELFRRGKLAEAEKLGTRIRKRAPDSYEVVHLLGVIKLQRGDAAAALGLLEAALKLEPGAPDVLGHRGNALAMLGRLDQALAQYDALLTARPGQPEVHFNRGLALASLGRHADAIAGYDQALAHRPGYRAAQLNRAVALQALNRHADAIAGFEAMLARNPADADATHNAALSRLTLGDYAAGFKQYEARFARSGMPGPRRDLGKPPWLGEYPPQRQTVLMHAEQGFGDTIQFARYAPMVARLGGRVVLEVPTELVSLLGRVEGVAQVVRRGAALPDFDLHCPMGSLPLALKTEVASVPGAPYLAASEARIAAWQARLSALPRPRVAFLWAGGAGHPDDRNRSLALAQLRPLLDRAGVSFISLQREPSTADAAALAGMPQVTALGAALRDFDDTAAALALCDLVIAVDTSLAHLAGALGRPTWILLPFRPDWRWMLDRPDSPWYPSARLYRQSAPGDWASVVARVREDLAGMAGKPGR
jgi:tetratricopeptide (TPR) repeat protein